MKSIANYKVKSQNHADRECSSLSDAKKCARQLIKDTGMHPNDFKGIFKQYYNSKGEFVNQKMCF